MPLHPNEIEKLREEFDIFPLWQLPAYVIKVTGYDKGGIGFSGQAFDIKSFISSLLTSQLQSIEEEVGKLLSKYKPSDIEQTFEKEDKTEVLNEVLSLLASYKTNPNQTKQ